MARTTVALVVLFVIAGNVALANGPPVAPPNNDSTSERAGIEFFEANIRPVLVAACYKCHSNQAVRVRADLLLDSREGLLHGGESGAVVSLGEPERSRLIEAIRWTNPDFQMPPTEPLRAEQVKLFEQWIEMGAPYSQQEQANPASNDLPIPESDAKERQPLWVLQAVVRPEVPTRITSSSNPIDALIAAEYAAKRLVPAGPADKATLLRRVYLDLIGIPPSLSEQSEFLADTSADAYEKVVDRLLENEQHAVRYARHWLDVLRYADVDERLIAARGIHLWRDWIIRALQDDLPYDQFVRAQLTGYRSTQRTQMSATGQRSRAEPRPDDLFALGFLARGAVIRDGKQEGELAINAVDTVSSALMGLTVACAKCHDHVYDPIKQRDYYAMKALFDPLVPRKITLATADELFASGRARQEAMARRAPVEAQMEALLEPFKKKLYDDRVAMLPGDVQAIILKPERQRSVTEQKIADDYFPILRIDLGKILEVVPKETLELYRQFERQLRDVERAGSTSRTTLAEFWTVEVDPKKEMEKSYILTSGDPERPELDREVGPGWPFAPAPVEFREGRIEAFSDWLTAPDNPLLARVAVNRIWQWHFGEGLHKAPSDFGKLSGVPAHARLLDWLASEFVRNDFSMRAMHRLIVTSQTYRLASQMDPSLMESNRQVDPTNGYLWHFPLQRLDAEAIWDSIFSAADSLDLQVGGPSFSPGSQDVRPGMSARDKEAPLRSRRAAYMTRGYSTNREVMANFLQTFDVDDGRVPCPLRTQTVTATQGLFMMNSDEVERATSQLAARLEKESAGDLSVAIRLGYRIALAREPSPHECEQAAAYLQNDPIRLKGLAWILFNLDEFIYVR